MWHLQTFFYIFLSSPDSQEKIFIFFYQSQACYNQYEHEQWT